MKTRRILVPVLLLAGAALWPAQDSPQKAALPVVAPPRDPGLYVRIETSMGPITARLFEKEAPLTVKNFRALAEGGKSFRDPKTGQMVRRPLYNGVAIHRVIPGFMIQMGDPTGTGGFDPGFTIPDEFDPGLRFDRPGRLAMANTGDKNSGNCQFFITEVPTPHLNNLHTIFGQVVEGQEVVKKIGAVPRDANNKPRTPVTILRLSFQREGAAPPAKK
ncbi:MAG: peptidylprolyl isomerase [Bryobacterales bacterium]|nr:peptidylprolyl isomerase [Bryobacterales bacterium]